MINTKRIHPDADPSKALDDPEPRWPALVSGLTVGLLYLALPKELTIGPRWLLIVIVGALMLPTAIAHNKGRHDLNQLFGYLLLSVMTAFIIGSLALLVAALPEQKEKATHLLGSALALWVSNVLIFAGWYWRLDAGGPNERDKRARHDAGAFLFPQMTMSDDARKAADQENWSPEFIDYLFLSFNTSAAFSPTDTLVLSQWAKILMMIQSSISIMIIALLAGRAVNIL